ncbi:FtsX-like permease family protein [Cellulomonas sp. HZM]|uniref:FtsX-like permease family protein n=1 Tax=Cellulomonas sp. HZM TaxID=1454010 RepID=UPI0012DF4963|nr:FtsX-like permease family protein [Cellulomonas sp. HZM]
MIALPVAMGVGGGVLLQSSLPSLEHQARERIGPQAQAVVRAVAAGPIVQDGLGMEDRLLPGTPDAPPLLSGVTEAIAAAVPVADSVVPAHFLDARTTSESGSVRGRVWSVPADGIGALPQGQVVEGALPTTAGQAVVGQDVARALGVRIGDRLEVRTSPTRTDDVTVTALTAVADGSSHAIVVADGSVPTTPSDLSRWFVTGPEPVSWTDVQKLNHSGLMATSRAVVADPPPRPRGLPAESGPTASTAALVAAVCAMGVLEIVLLVGPAFAVGARRSSRALALVAVAGGDGRTLRRITLLGGAVVGVLASSVGVVVGLVGAVALRAVLVAAGSRGFPELRFPWAAVAAVAVLGLVVAVGAAWLPARRAGRIDPVAVLSGRRSEAAPRRRVPVVGTVLALAGVAAAVAGAATGHTAMLVGGVVALQVGAVAASGGLVQLAGLAAPFLPVAGRIAVRDAARQRGRTAPAVAAVLAGVAGIVAGIVFMSSENHDGRESYVPVAAVGAVVAQPGQDDDEELSEHLTVADVADRVREATGADVALVRAASVDGSTALWLDGARTAGNVCPDGGKQSDPRCRIVDRQSFFRGNGDMVPNVLVDNGTVAPLLGFPAAATTALRQGRIVVDDPRMVAADGTVRLTTLTVKRDPVTVTMPATLVAPGSQFGFVVPPSRAAELGIGSTPIGAVALPARALDDAQEARLAKALGTGAYAQVERGYERSVSSTLWVLVLVALVVGLGSAGLAVALAANELRPDLATLAAVGAAPSVRRRVGAAQAGVISVLGVTVGTAAGLVLGGVLWLQKRQLDPLLHGMWVPWTQVVAVLVGVPALTMAGAYLLTRSRLPMTRRVDA